jgi:DNA-binding NarL/FixJ family response regulator
MALGLSNKEIAQSLTISVETVKEHVQNILRKIAVGDRTQAAVWAVRRGLV